jgi:hypothetical protein
MEKLVYLAGPITGLSYGGAVDWREEAITRLKDIDVRGLSPMRGKTYLLKETNIGDSYGETLLSSQASITMRDRFDCMRSNMIIFNFLGAERVSIGSCIELGWADAFRVPAILLIEKDKNVHDHSMVRQICGWRVDNLDDAIAIVGATL